MPLVSQAEFARLKGTSRKTVTQWKKDGRLVFAGALIDVDASQEKLLRGASHASKGQRASVTRAEPPVTGNAPAKVTRDPSPPAADALVSPSVEAEPEDIAASADAFAAEVLAGKFRPKGEAETIKENALALKQVLEVRRLSGALVSRAAVVDACFKAARAERDTMLAWPSRVAPLIAADLGADPGKVAGLLAEHMHELLTDLGEPEVDLDDAA